MTEIQPICDQSIKTYSFLHSSIFLFFYFGLVYHFNLVFLHVLFNRLPDIQMAAGVVVSLTQKFSTAIEITRLVPSV